MSINKKSVPPPEVWWGSDPFGTSVEADTTKQYKEWLSFRRRKIADARDKPLEHRLAKKPPQSKRCVLVKRDKG